MTVDQVISHPFHLSQILLLYIVSFRLGSYYSLGGSQCKHGVSPSFGQCPLLCLAVSQLRERRCGQSPWQPQAYHFLPLCPATAKSHPKSGTDAGHQTVWWWWWKTELSIKLAYCSLPHQCTSWRIYPHNL